MCIYIYIYVYIYIYKYIFERLAEYRWKPHRDIPMSQHYALSSYALPCALLTFEFAHSSGSIHAATAMASCQGVQYHKRLIPHTEPHMLSSATGQTTHTTRQINKHKKQKLYHACCAFAACVDASYDASAHARCRGVSPALPTTTIPTKSC